MFNLLKRSLFRIILGWMAANLILVSIPRCDVVFDILRHALQKQPTAGMSDHCAQHPATKGPAFADHRFCECSLAQFMAVALPKVDREPVITRLPQAVVVDLAPYRFSVTHNISLLDTPPPRSI